MTWLIMSSSILLYLIFLYLSLKIFRYICLFLYISDQSLDTFIELVSFESAPESDPYSLKIFVSLALAFRLFSWHIAERISQSPQSWMS